MSGKTTPAITGESSTRPGRPIDEEVQAKFDQACDWLESNGDDLLTLDDIEAKIGMCSNVWLKKKLQLKYKESLVFYSVEGKKDVVCFKNLAAYLINNKWYEDRASNFEEEKIRIVKAAANIVADEIREKNYDKNMYPSPDDMADAEHGKKWVVSSLLLFLKKLISCDVKIAAIGKAVMNASRPRSLISPIMLGLGVEMDHKFGSKWLNTELFRLGFSVSYDEVTKYKLSAINSDVSSAVKTNSPEGFTQWIADNVDHNIATLDGRGTFHGMGIISASIKPAQRRQILVPRSTTKLLVSDVIDSSKQISIFPYYEQKNILSTITFKPLIQLQQEFILPKTIDLHLLWQAAPDDQLRPGWSGFMSNLSPNESEVFANEINFLPLISFNSSDKSCIYSTLLFTENQAKKLNIETPCVTFDQPLYIKAFEIIQTKKLNIVCRLGGFHMLMSFLGSVGNFMAGSGLEQIFELFYAENTVPHIMSGKAIARALRAHFILQSALYKKLLSNITEDDFLDSIYTAYTLVVSKEANVNTEDVAEILQKLKNHLCPLIKNLKKSSRTAKLWLQYIEYVDIIKIFIRAERTADWQMHLYATRKMLNLFAATGHAQYARCGRLYLQTMLDLPQTHPWLHQKFQAGNHAPRRTDKYWAGIWTDLLIEQSLMRTLKTRGGLTDGRGMTESVRQIWVFSMPICAVIHEAMTKLTKNNFSSSVQHVDISQSRMKRDDSDLALVLNYFKQRNPFDPNDARLRSLSTGLFDSDQKLNCDLAEEIGEEIMKKLDNSTASSFSIKRSDQIKSLKTLQSNLKVDGDTVQVDNEILFWRLITIAERDGELKDYMKYELTVQPASLFQNTFMKKADKPTLIRALLRNLDTQDCDSSNDRSNYYVLDGGNLLHFIRRNGKTYDDVMKQYTEYISRTYQNKKVTIVFDGYKPSTKDHEHRRRTCNRLSADLDVLKDDTVHPDQTAFLANTQNKVKFIKLLSDYLKEEGHIVTLSDDDADVSIVSAALELAKNLDEDTNVTVVAEDTDIIIMLLYHYKITMKKIFVSRRKSLLDIALLSGAMEPKLRQN